MSENSDDQDSVGRAEPLKQGERAIAIIVGIIAGGAGGYAVFVSANQAGTSVLLILSATFLLIGVQGTSLIRFSTGSNTVELERKRRVVEVEKAAEEAVQEDDIDRAAGIVEGAALADPELSLSPRARSMLYEKRLDLALSEMGYLVLHPDIDTGIDLVARKPPGGEESGTETFEIKFKYLSSGRPISLDSAESAVRGRADRIIPLLVVVNTGYTKRVAETIKNAPGAGARIVAWRDVRDNEALADSIKDLFRSV